MRIILSLFVLVLLAACASPTTHYPSIDKAEIEQERIKQQEMVNNKRIKEKQRKGLQLAEHQKRLINVSTKIMQGGMDLCNRFTSAQYGCVFEFEVSKEYGVNAYADGKKIVVSQAMMNFAETDEELAIVLGHEYAHNIMGHIAAKQKNVLFGSLLGMAIDTVASTQGIGTGSTFSKIGTSAGALQYSQEFEKEADYVGLYITYLAGYDISNAPEFWRKMSLRDEKSISEAYTHPTNPERYVGLDKTIREIKSKKKIGMPLLPELKLIEN